MGVIGGTLLAFGTWYTFTGALLLHLSFVFDLVDGEVARYRKSESLTGIYLELLCHHIVNPLVLMGISFGVYNIFHDPKVFIFGFSAILSRKLVDLTRQCRFQAVLSGYFHHRSEENANKCQFRGHGKGDEILLVYGSEEKTYLTSRSQILYKISHIVLMLHGPVLISPIILLASLTDMVVPLMMIGPMKLNIMYVVLIFYGTFSHLVWLGLMFLTVKSKSIEKMYSLLLRARDVNCILKKKRKSNSKRK